MLPKPAASKNPPATSTAAGDALLLHDIETLSKALSLDSQKKPPNHSISAPKSHPDPNPNNPKKSNKIPKKPSFWSNFNPVKSISSQFNRSNRRFSCQFSLHVHSIDNLHQIFLNSSIFVQWKRTTDQRISALSTRAVRVFDSTVKFDEILTYSCSVNGFRNGAKGSAKYEPKHFLVSVKVVDNEELDLGKNLIDLTRLLPMSLEELDEEEKRSGKWSTSFRLSRKAKGAILNVSFGFLVVGNNNEVVGYEKKVGRVGSSARSWDWPRSVEDVKVLHEVLLPCSKLDASDFNGGGGGKFGFGGVDELRDLKAWKGDREKECEEPEFTVIEHGVEIAEKNGIGEPKLEKIESKPEEGVEVIAKNQVMLPEIEKIGFRAEEGVEFMAKDKVREPELEKIEFEAEKGGEVATKDELCELESEKGGEVTTKDQLCELELENVGFNAEEGLEVTEKDQLCELESEKIEFNSEEVTKKNQLCDSNDSENTDIEKVEKEPYLQSEEVLCDYGDVFECPVTEDLDAGFSSSSILDWEKNMNGMGIEPKTPDQMSYAEVKASYKAGGMRSKSLSLEDEAVASEFLTMLGIDHSPSGLSSDSDPASPRGRLWKQFKEESLSTSSSIFDIEIGAGMEPNWVNRNFAEDFDLSSIVQEAEMEFQKATEGKSRAKMMEDAETEALMREWGLDEKAFHRSQPASSSGFGSPIDLPPEEPLELPPLGEGLGPFFQTKDGGFLRSMNPSLFKNAKNNGNLIMQVSSPIVVPAEMGSGIMEILQRLASVGIEKLSMQAKKLMPLEEITGKTMQQIAWEAAPALESCERQEILQHLKGEAEPGVTQFACRRSKKSKTTDTASEYVSLEDLAPLAMDKIEALSIEGLRIQSGISDEEAPSNISPQSIGDISALVGRGAMNSMSLGLEGTGGLQLMDDKDSGDDVDGLMGLSITLDEWMRLDSGVVDEEEDIISDHTSKILAAHHARFTEIIKADKRGGKRSGRKWGLLGNTFTVALMVQLRDPLRNYEPVGTPMLSLIQVERVFVPPKPKIYSMVSEKGNSEEQDDGPENKTETVAKEEKKEEEEVVPQFKITEVHVAGIKTEPGKKKLWGNPIQQQSGSRWLLATGMGKSNKHPFMKSKTISKPSQVTATIQPGDTLWSISSRVHGNGAKWKELLALNPHIRNPNVIFPNEKIRLR